MQNEGWKCPVCGAGVAPSVLKCEHKQVTSPSTYLLPTCTRSPTGYCTCTGICVYGTFGLQDPFTAGIVG